MVSNELFAKALRICPKGARLVIIGDGDQLEPIDAGAPFLQLLKSGIFPVVELKGQHRSGGGIVKACQEINQGIFPENRPGDLSPEKDRAANIGTFEFVERPDEEKFEYLAEALKNKNIDQTQVVTTSNNERHAVNRWHREQKGYPIDRVCLGERLCGNRNNYETGARNGEIGIVENIRRDGAFEVNFANNPKMAFYNPPAPAVKKDKRKGPNGDLDWATCLTGNKCQGSEWDHVIVHLTGRWLVKRRWATRKWLYTVVSRGRKSVVIFGNRGLVELILANGADCFRITILDEMVRERFAK
jgi:ATP-dependent exoDNAse (exonuclease V) alpha subunit